MRLTFANAVSLCALFLMVASPSFAQEGTNKSVQGLVKVHEKESISARLFEANRSAGVSPASSTVDEGMRWVDWPTLGRDGEGRACIGRGGKLVEDGVDVGALIGGKQEEFQRGLTDAAYSGDNAAVCARPATADPVAVVVATVREQLPRVSVRSIQSQAVVIEQH